MTRQTVHKALDIANSKVQKSLEEIAKINKIKIQTLNPANGVLIGYSTHFKTKAIVTFSARTGIQVWYRHEGDCRSCDELQACREMLLAEARDRNIQLPENASSMSPSGLANVLFSKITVHEK